jgi:UDP-N-acetylglucosamine 4,6-dehydratase
MLTKLLENVKDLIDDKIVFITGGSGSFGNKLTEVLLENFKPKKIIIFSRDEYKQYIMKQKFPETKYNCMRYFVGDVRDYERLTMATKNVDIIFHAAAMKQVDTIEYNPIEAIKTNINGTENIVKVAILNNIKKVIGISTDKCVNPINLYGATKLCLEKIIIYGNMMSGENGPIFSVLRYGNVFGSRGSVAPLFMKQKEKKEITITDSRMTRFTITLKEAIIFVLNSASIMKGGEIFVPKLPSYNIVQLAQCIDIESKIKYIGKRPGEKIDELMISNNESYRTLILDSFYVILPEIKINKNYSKYGTNFMEDNSEYSSGKNTLISDEDLKLIIKNECI